jgi:hypothetical protein
MGRLNNIELNRKVLADLAMNHPVAFKAILNKVNVLSTQFKLLIYRETPNPSIRVFFFLRTITNISKMILGFFFELETNQ